MMMMMTTTTMMLMLMMRRMPHAVPRAAASCCASIIRGGVHIPPADAPHLVTHPFASILIWQGVLFAANMRGEANGGWIAEALRGMTTSNEAAAQCVMRHGASSCTDVTGFGMMGHLLEMAKASNALISVRMSQVRA